MKVLIVVVTAIVLAGACSPGPPGGTSTVRNQTPMSASRAATPGSVTPTTSPTTYPGQRGGFQIPPAPGRTAVIELPDTVLHFALGSSDLAAADVEALTALGRDIALLRPTKVTVAGYCDESGGPGYPNQALSEARANRVKEILVRAPLDPRIVQAIGYGDTRPLPPPAPPRANRRVVITVEKGAP